MRPRSNTIASSHSVCGDGEIAGDDEERGLLSTRNSASRSRIVVWAKASSPRSGSSIDDEQGRADDGARHLQAALVERREARDRAPSVMRGEADAFQRRVAIALRSGRG